MKGLGSFLVAFALLALASVAQAEGWQLKRSEEGVRVWTRPVEGSAIEEFRGETFVSASPEECLALLRDASKSTRWFPNTSESRTLSREGDVELRYVVMDAPWPVDDRDAVYRFTTTRGDDGSIGIDIGVEPDAVARESDRVRVLAARGQWRFTPRAGGTTVLFEMHFDPAGSVPQWLSNLRVVETPYESLRGMQRELAHAKP